MANKTIELNRSAASGTYIVGKIVCDATADNTLNNSDVTARIYVRKDNDSTLLTIPTSGKWTYGMTINGKAFSGTVSKDVLLDWVLLATVSVNDIAHNDDGTKSIAISGYVTSPSTSVVVGHKTSGSGTFTLDTVPRASAIASAGNITLGNACNVKWTPAAESFRYRLQFVMKNWSYITEVIHPNRKSLYTYDGYVIPLDAAFQIPNTKTDTMAVALYTYSDSAATKQVGSTSYSIFNVTVPDNEDTKPVVSMTLSPVSSLPSAFDGLYIQGKSKVKVALSATGRYGAAINSYIANVDGISHVFRDSYTSDYLYTYGNKTVYGYAIDSRDITGITSQNITVIPYNNPKLLPVSGEKNVVVARCDKDGNNSESGTYLKIKAKRSYSHVVSGGVQKNFCKIQYRYKKEGGSYSEWVTILDRDSGSDEVITGALLGGALVTTASYLVDVRAIDDIGSQAPTTYTIPTDKIYTHKNGSLNSFGFGTYVEEANTFLTGDDITLKSRGKLVAKNIMLMEQEITVGGDLNTYYPVHIVPSAWVNSQPFFLGIGKMLGTTSPAWEGNNSSGTSSLMIGWMFRYFGWEGNGSYLNTLYKEEKYAKLIAHVEGQTGAGNGIVVWLRGGGASYKITCSVPASVSVYLENKDISVTSGYEQILKPRGYEGNYGVNFAGGGVKDMIVEEGTSGIWRYRKWHSGVAECWCTKDITANITTAWGGIYTSGALAETNIVYPFAFVGLPILNVSLNAIGTSAFLMASGGSGVQGSSTQTGTYEICRGSLTEIGWFSMSYHAKGRWK